MKMLRLREDAPFKFEEFSFEVHGSRSLRAIDLENEQVEFLKKISLSGIAISDVRKMPKKLLDLLRLLKNRELLRIQEKDYSRDEIWLSHYVDDARSALKELSKKRVLILGCGGTGSIIADHLARAGVRKFTLVDGALLDEPDLNRQFVFSKTDLGRPKAQILAEILKKNFEVSAEWHEVFIQSNKDLLKMTGEYDLVICCADKPQFLIETLCIEFASKFNFPILFGNVGIDDDKVGPLLRNQTERDREFQRLGELRSLKIEAPIIQGSLCFSNTIAAAKIGFVAYKFLLGMQP